ncbi:MbnP family copper-binding protein [Pseudobowmanella zhangzhouensis]|uniref:MbnP family copper-binding protein n=1 Tax=Pseudobowmanella zhangzhouensis TaxID=1537679 RepID=A0ABW1XND0_9ALTE
MFRHWLGLFILLLTLSACGSAPSGQSLSIELRWQGKPIGCGGQLDNGWQVQELRFYLYQLTASDDSGEHSLHVNQQADNESNVSAEVTLAEFSCQAEALRAPLTIAPAIPEGSDQLSFVIGVPFELNHQNPLQQPAPLNRPDMFWSWQGGHKFVRLEMARADQHFSFHLGSTGCAAASKVRAPQTACEEPNTVAVSLPWQAGKHIVLDLAKLLGDDPDQKQSCTFHFGEEQACASLLQHLPQAFEVVP